MEQGLQQVNHRSRLMEWSRRVEACRNSGQRVSEWCGGMGFQYLRTIAGRGRCSKLRYQRMSGNFQWPRNGEEARQLTAQQYRRLMEGLSVEQPKAHKTVSGLNIV